MSGTIYAFCIQTNIRFKNLPLNRVKNKKSVKNYAIDSKSKQEKGFLIVQQMFLN
jgi:hypothetical protein